MMTAPKAMKQTYFIFDQNRCVLQPLPKAVLNDDGQRVCLPDVPLSEG